MRRSSLLLVALIFTLSTHAETAIKQRIIELRKQGVDTAVLFDQFSTGSMTLPGQNYFPAQSQYLIWSQNNHSYIQRFDDCYRYKPRRISPLFMHLVLTQYNELKHEEILPTKFRKRGIFSFFSSYRMYITHSGFTQFIIYNRTSALKKTIDDFNLETEFDGENRNVNYVMNQRTIQSQLKKIALHATRNSKIYVSGINGKPGKVNPAPECGHFVLVP